MLKLIRTLVLLTTTIFLLSRCDSGEGPSDLVRFTSDAFKDHAPVVDPLPPPRPYSVFLYTASNLVDPFDDDNLAHKDVQKQQPGDGLEPDASRLKEPLEDFPLGSLKMVGTMEKKDEIWAVIQAPNNSIHRVKAGNFLGQNYGKIVVITETSVAIKALMKDPSGNMEVREESLDLVK